MDDFFIIFITAITVLVQYVPGILSNEYSSNLTIQ